MEDHTVENTLLKLESAFVSEKPEEEFLDSLEKLTLLMLSSESRNDLQSNHWSVIGKLAEKGSQILLKEKKLDKELKFLTFLLRFLRNSCGGSFENQDNLIKTSSVLNFAKESLEHFLDADEGKLILKISIQLFGNILLCNENTKPLVWDIFKKGLTFKKFLSQEDESIKECAMMVLFHCLNDQICKCICTSEDNKSILCILIDLYLKNEIQWIPDVMNHLLEQDLLLISYYQLDSFHRCVVLEAIYIYLENDENKKILNSSITKVMEVFQKDLSDTLHSFLSPYELMRMLSILCRASVMESYMKILQNNKELPETCVVSLKVIHLLRSQNNMSFPTESASSYQGLKSQLIRLIGNLCYKCKENQNNVRNLDGIPLILDCCQVDEENPFIREWCILAIRNLLENNLENQTIIAGISTSGEVVQSEYLSSVGLEAQNEGGQIRIRSKPKSNISET